MRHSSTTHPSASTDRRPSHARPTHIRWVFPQPQSTSLDNRRVVGRDDDCDTVLTGTEASRRHAEFRLDGPITAVRDLGSRNGVYVNGIRRPDSPLVVGDVVRCGEWIGVVVAQKSDESGFREIAPGWYGGGSLFAAAEPGRRVGPDLPIIIQGETGTGKEGMARALHQWSGRQGPFVAINCATLPANLAEAELFGYRKGAFTGADVASPGLFRAAHGGTLFLDEVLELPLTLQPKLLRVLEERQVRALGEARDTAIDVRTIAATQEPLAVAVEERRFRADLLARLDGLTLILPPLRARREDVAPLFLELIRQYAGGRGPGIEPKLVETLCLYDWPLNVRELVLLARRLLSLHGHEATLKKTDLPERILSRLPGALSASPSSKPAKARAWRRTDDQKEFDALIVALRDHGGSVAKAAAAIGLSRPRAYRMLAAHPDFSIEGSRK